MLYLISKYIVKLIYIVIYIYYNNSKYIALGLLYMYITAYFLRNQTRMHNVDF